MQESKAFSASPDISGTESPLDMVDMSPPIQVTTRKFLVHVSQFALGENRYVHEKRFPTIVVRDALTGDAILVEEATWEGHSLIRYAPKSERETLKRPEVFIEVAGPIKVEGRALDSATWEEFRNRTAKEGLSYLCGENVNLASIDAASKDWKKW